MRQAQREVVDLEQDATSAGRTVAEQNDADEREALAALAPIERLADALTAALGHRTAGLLADLLQRAASR